LEVAIGLFYGRFSGTSREERAIPSSIPGFHVPAVSLSTSNFFPCHDSCKRNPEFFRNRCRQNNRANKKKDAVALVSGRRSSATGTREMGHVHNWRGGKMMITSP